MKTANLYMIMLGCTPKGRFTEQHDIFFGIGTSLKALVPDMKAFWPEAKGKIHIDAWRKVTCVDGFSIEVVSKTEKMAQEEQLFFLNLGGYKEGEFEEYHYKVLVVATTKAEAIKKAKQTTFYKHYNFKGAASHIDDKFGVDVDDIHNIEEILSDAFKSEYGLQIKKTNTISEDEKHIGYLKIDTIKI
ncbi:DUF1543 domain-containing protein [Flavobacterium sp.]|jgi:hypothetical protein|uniref:DUF1543 domain-containing protein n=1 Tax=Flavobacterium sp. TaxID=239 RepID=UPI0037BF2896